MHLTAGLEAVRNPLYFVGLLSRKRIQRITEATVP